MSVGGALGSENVGMSNHNLDEKSRHRKTKVSWATLIVPGLVGPKPRLKSVGDGQQVDIPVLPPRFHGDAEQKSEQIFDYICSTKCELGNKTGVKSGIQTNTRTRKSHG